ncbi:MAG TPA: DUF1800 domain-containing protein [Candidatus Saccharimonadales bacterium]|nr:DUF1800 domain-containing protein [Candidatus Saccharimonadales bacterium]
MLKELSANRWDYDTAAHLLNRAGFGGPPAAIEALAGLSPDNALSTLLDYERIPDATLAPDWAHPDSEGVRRLREEARNATQDERRKLYREEMRVQFQRLMELRGWWLNRMAKGPRPFQEKMVLFWHGHFATSFVKVRNAYYMWRQNELFRRLATGNWQEMLSFVGKDPAMLIWLDQAESRRPHANENFAREVMELFTLGEGHYTEKDVTEGARALTGWSLDRLSQQYVYRRFFHDNGIKTYLGNTGNLNGDDVIRIIVEQPQAARFITAKLWNYFAGQPPSDELNDALAAVFRENGNNFKPFLRVMFRSEEFYDPAIVRNSVKSPVQWLVGTARILECDLPPTIVCEGITRRLGQDLFAPPNVKGWDGGISWITTTTLFDRYNTAALLVQGMYIPEARLQAMQQMEPMSGNESQAQDGRVHVGGVAVDKILSPDERGNKDRLVAALQHRLLQSALKGDQAKALDDFLSARDKLNEADIRAAIRLVMCTPEYQVT